MGPTMKDLGIDKLQPDERRALAVEIWDSLGTARPGSLISDEQWAEIHRRDAEMDAEPRDRADLGGTPNQTRVAATNRHLIFHRTWETE